MLWLGLHFPLLPLEVFTGGEHRPAHAEAAVEEPPRVVIEDGRVMLRNAAAVAAGVAAGCTLATAHSIAPGLVHHPRSPAREHQRLTLIAEALYGFSARVSLSPAAAGAPAPGIVLEIGASLKLFGDAEPLSRQVEALCRNLGHAVRGRRAATPLAALILARAGAERLEQVPIGQAAVEPERLPGSRVERLANMGIRTLGQLLALPARELGRRLGADLVGYLERITGARPDPRPTVAPAEQFRTVLHLQDPLNDKTALLFPVQRLLGDLQHWLIARQLGAEQLRWQFSAAGGEHTRVSLPVRFARARQRREAFLGITRLELDRAELPEDVTDITLEAHGLVPWRTGSRGLFRDLPQAPGDLGDAGELVDQLRARLGEGTCYSLQAVDQHTPERAWRAVAPLGRREPPAVSRTAQRPLWLFDPPHPVALEHLELLRGPERLHTGWWSSASAAQARDYYVARHRNGAECWVFVDPSERWFLHGYFA